MQKLPFVFNKYELTEFIGEGGIAKIYKGKNLDNPTSGLEQAIKIVRDEVNTTLASTQIEQQGRAHKALSSIDGVVQVYEYDAHHQPPFLTSEYISGKSLQKRLSDEKFNTAEALRIIIDICSILDEAHKKEVIHGDISPGNILFTEKNQKIKITDFQNPSSVSHPETSVEQSIPFSKPVNVYTQHYAAPESLSKSQYSVQSDIYGIGKMFFELLGKSPNDNTFNLPKNITPELIEIYNQCVAINPQDRFESYTALIDALKKHLKSIPKEENQNSENEQETENAFKRTAPLKEKLATLYERTKELYLSEKPDWDKMPEHRTRILETLSNRKTIEKEIEELENQLDNPSVPEVEKLALKQELKQKRKHLYFDIFSADKDINTRYLKDIPFYQYPINQKVFEENQKPSNSQESSYLNIMKDAYIAVRQKIAVMVYEHREMEYGHELGKTIKSASTKGIDLDSQIKRAKHFLSKTNQEVEKLLHEEKDEFKELSEDDLSKQMSETKKRRAEIEKQMSELSFWKRGPLRKKAKALTQRLHELSNAYRKKNEIESTVRHYIEIKRVYNEMLMMNKIFQEYKETIWKYKKNMKELDDVMSKNGSGTYYLFHKLADQAVDKGTIIYEIDNCIANLLNPLNEQEKNSSADCILKIQPLKRRLRELRKELDDKLLGNPNYVLEKIMGK